MHVVVKSVKLRGTFSLFKHNPLHDYVFKRSILVHIIRCGSFDSFFVFVRCSSSSSVLCILMREWNMLRGPWSTRDRVEIFRIKSEPLITPQRQPKTMKKSRSATAATLVYTEIEGYNGTPTHLTAAAHSTHRFLGQFSCHVYVCCCHLSRLPLGTHTQHTVYFTISSEWNGKNNRNINGINGIPTTNTKERWNNKIAETKEFPYRTTAAFYPQNTHARIPSNGHEQIEKRREKVVFVFLLLDGIHFGLFRRYVSD